MELKANCLLSQAESAGRVMGWPHPGTLGKEPPLTLWAVHLVASASVPNGRGCACC